jgi:cobalt-zinc-cadmium efflux system protein
MSQVGAQRHEHRHDGAADRRLLAASLALILAFMVAEVVVGLLASSLALLADAGHMLTDAAGLALAVFASWAASLPARGRWTFGFGRVEIFAAQANGFTLLLIAGVIVAEAIRRLLAPPDVEAGLVGIVALAGIAVDLGAVALLARAHRESLNVRGAYLHLVTDLAAFLGTGLAAALILLTGWNRFDPIASLAVASLMLGAAWSLLKESGRIFLEGAPTSAPPSEVGRATAIASAWSSSSSCATASGSTTRRSRSSTWASGPGSRSDAGDRPDRISGYPGSVLGFVAAVHVLISIFLVVLVLMHSGRDTGFGGMGFTPASQGGQHIVERNLTRLTVAVGAAFAITTIALFYLLK